MGHSVNDEYLYKNNIDGFFSELSSEIKNRDIGLHRILVVGGAAMALKYQDERSTVDIDICFREQHDLYLCCQYIAKKHNLPEDWINADVMHSDSFSFKLFDNAELYKVYDNILEIYVADDLDLYCMKLVSFRPKDIQDMETISKKLKESGVKQDDVTKNFTRLYGSEYYLRNDERKVQFMKLQLGWRL